MTLPQTDDLHDADLTVKSQLDRHDLATRLRSDDIWYDHDDPLTVILIHGFRTDETHAARNYRTFKRRLHDIDPRLDACTLTFSWPSTSSIWDGLEFFRAKDKVARQAGRILGDGLLRDLRRRRTMPRDYVLVSHSLGGRVVMEALARVLSEDPAAGPRFRAVLMAAALPVEDYGQDDILTDYTKIVQQIRSADVLYSEADWILRDIFPAGLLWTSHQAVGLEGLPAHPWSVRTPLAPFVHTDYWKDKDARVSTHLGERLGFVVPRTLPQDVAVPGDVLPSV